MLVLSRKPGEQIVVGDHIRVTILSVEGNRVRLGLQAPPDVSIVRHEITLPGLPRDGELLSAAERVAE